MRYRGTYIHAGILALTFVGLNLAPVFAQLASPGKLSNAHKNLEGVGNCTKCHNFGEQTFRNNCLDCHDEIQSRVDAKHGYHYYTRKLECSKCHKEHHGRDFKLIRWDPSKFDHKQTGFTLKGSHEGLDCNKCHAPGNIVHSDIKKKPKSVQNRTYLGLDPACGNCHEDEHRGQLSKQCGTCHSESGWKKNSFAHSQARFKLQGKHASVECAKCHPTQTDSKTIAGDNRYLKFKGIAFSQCSDCHEDPHKGGFGKECSSCHSPTDWHDLSFSASDFDHSKTHFPLKGKHEAVPCMACHQGGNFKRFKTADLTQCGTCHEDYHKGQFAERKAGDDCSGCHTVDGYTPSTFTLADHVTAEFKLTGAHNAIPCAGCHSTTTIEGEKTRKFHWESTECTVCHADPHAGQFAARMQRDGCASCHNTESWFWMEFDHATTSFPLVGKHQTVLCGKCHVEGEVNGVRAKVFQFDDTTCDACHEDRHLGQFAEANGTVDCAKCHTPYGWKNLQFLHNSMSRFKLTGKHETLSCDRCHKVEVIIDGQQPVTRYKPLAAACSSCHGAREESNE